MTPLDPDALRSADDVSRALVTLFGVDPASDRGVLHSASVWEGPHGTRAIRIGEHAPGSRVDYFLLHVARARASAIVTTGRILRDEPRLRYDLGASSGFVDALTAYRGERVGLRNRATVVVLSHGKDIDFAHPTFHGWAKPLLMVPESAPSSLGDLAEFHGIALRRLPQLDLDSALASLRNGGHGTVLIEAGASTTRPRYERGRGFDELVLSRYLGAAIDSRAIGGEFPDRAMLERIYGEPRHEHALDEASGEWSIARYRRASSKSVPPREG